MQMSDFIEREVDAIVDEWEGFAGEQHPAATGMSRDELRNLAAEILCAIARDMRVGETEKERHDKSRGGTPKGQPPDVTDTARGHASERLTQGFALDQLASEYRALRATVVRRWRADLDACDETALEELTRFNEAIDESLTESICWYHARIEDARDLLNGVLAHDLRSPLGAILASAEVFLQDSSLSAEQTRIAVRLRNSASRMRSMITDLLDFTRTRLGTGLPMAIGRYSMASIIRDVCEEQQAFHPQATIRCEYQDELIGHWDHGRIAQLLANLIDNAVRHGSERPILVKGTAEDDDVFVEVHNEGAVISRDEQRVIFDPWRIAAARGDYEKAKGAGLGLGLYIVRQIAEAHGGGVDVRSSEDEGTTFTVRLPRRAKEGSASAGLT